MNSYIVHKYTTLNKAQYSNRNLRHAIGYFSNTEIKVSCTGSSIKKVWSPQMKPDILRIISTLQFGTGQLNHATWYSNEQQSPHLINCATSLLPPYVCRYRRSTDSVPSLYQATPRFLAEVSISCIHLATVFYSFNCSAVVMWVRGNLALLFGRMGDVPRRSLQ